MAYKINLYKREDGSRRVGESLLQIKLSSDDANDMCRCEHIRKITQSTKSEFTLDFQWMWRSDLPKDYKSEFGNRDGNNPE